MADRGRAGGRQRALRRARAGHARAARGARSRPCCRERTRWVAVTAASNAVGTMPDLPGIVAAARRAGARVYVDAVHAAPHRRHHLAALDVDALACSAYKWFGPHVGVLCARPELLGSWSPDKLRPSSDGVPERWELGTLPFEALAGVGAAAEYVTSPRWDGGARARGRAARGGAAQACATIDGVTLYGDARDRTPTLMFTVAGLTRRPSPPRWPSARSPSGTATTTPGSSSTTSASPRTARCAPASCTTTTRATPSGCWTASARWCPAQR